MGYTLNTAHNQYVGTTCNFPNGCSVSHLRFKSSSAGQYLLENSHGHQVMGTWNSDGSQAAFNTHFVNHYGTSGVMPHFSPSSKTCGNGRNDMKRVCRAGAYRHLFFRLVFGGRTVRGVRVFQQQYIQVLQPLRQLLVRFVQCGILNFWGE